MRGSSIALIVATLAVASMLRLALKGNAGIDGIVEVFNVFNHANCGSYTTVESNRLYGQPSSNTNVAYQPRMAQVGFRFTY